MIIWIFEPELGSSYFQKIFICLRNTNAALQITAGTDIFTFSKMLGHRSFKAAQVYAGVIDQKKRDAPCRISLE